MDKGPGHVLWTWGQNTATIPGEEVRIRTLRMTRIAPRPIGYLINDDAAEVALGGILVMHHFNDVLRSAVVER